MCIVEKEEPRSSSMNLIVAMDVAMSSELVSGFFQRDSWPINVLLIIPGIELHIHAMHCCSGLSS